MKDYAAATNNTLVYWIPTHLYRLEANYMQLKSSMDISL